MGTYGNRVTIFEMTDEIARGLEGVNLMDFLEVFEEMDVKVLRNSRVTDISKDLVITYEKDRETNRDSFDFVVLSLGQKPHCEELEQALEDSDIEYKVIGDAANPSNFQNATTTAYFAALDA